MKIGVRLQFGLEGITADRCWAELSWQRVPHSRGSHAETPCSQLRPRSRNEQVATLSRTKTGQGSVVRHGNTDRRAWNMSAPCPEHSQKPANQPWTRVLNLPVILPGGNLPVNYRKITSKLPDTGNIPVSGFFNILQVQRLMSTIGRVQTPGYIPKKYPVGFLGWTHLKKTHQKTHLG